MPLSAARADGMPLDIEINPAVWTPPFDWSALFGNSHPVEVELGCGKGLFLREAARQAPQTNFLGVERAGKYFRTAVARLTRAELPNIRMQRADGFDVLDRWVAPRSIQRLHIYFPDPWPKKRHHKRRIVCPQMMRLAARALVPGGEFRVATDHEVYREIIREVLAAHHELFEPLPWPADAPDRLPTNYALKWQRDGRRLWWARFAVTDPASGGGS